ncbi:UvrD-helicase domain-containing protein [Novosphingobium sp. BL-52-GroH]|uniref:UvrD-helicase domain-containing protein n=1 Tax=Novosphingobium sp. BL-52-GroH TaxID=3349877 RepID=UPI0038518234
MSDHNVASRGAEPAVDAPYFDSMIDIPGREGTPHYEHFSLAGTDRSQELNIVASAAGGKTVTMGGTLPLPSRASACSSAIRSTATRLIGLGHPDPSSRIKPGTTISSIPATLDAVDPRRDQAAMIPTPEQQAILDRPPTGTVKVVAGAGCGKTSTLVRYGKRWPARALYLAFNRAIADEAGRKFPPLIETRTAHSFAHRALDVGRRTVDLVPRYRHEHLRAFDHLIQPVRGMTDWQVRAAILRTIDNFLIDAGSKIRPDHCDLASKSQRVPVREMTREIVRTLLKFDGHELPITHDTYLKAFELWHRIEGGFGYLLLDEAQDLNPVLISIARKAGLPTILVGDPYQSIYRFRGAVDAMDEFDTAELPLTHSWRFGPDVAALANRILRHSSRPPRHPLRGNPDRETQVLRYAGKLQPRPGTAILARTNARLFESLATIEQPFHLIGGIADLQRQLSSTLALRQRRHHQVMDAGVARFTSWALFDHAANRGDGEARRLRDIVERHGDRLPAILNRLGTLHRDREADAALIVSTAHKAKGREFDTVVVLDDFEDPANLVARRRKDMTKTVEADQQINLLYVACTRATHRLYLSPELHDTLC